MIAQTPVSINSYSCDFSIDNHLLKYFARNAQQKRFNLKKIIDIIYAMSRLIDKVILLALTVYTISLFVNGTDYLLCLYVAIICTSFNYYLLSRESSDYSMKLSDMKEKAAFSIETALVIAALKFPPLIAIIPLIIYDITWSRNYFAFLLGLIAILMNFSFPSGILVLIISFLSIIMSIKSEMIGKYSKDLKKMRDDSSEKTSRLRSQNTELLNARDTEIYNAQLSERNRIAREIHDNVGHTLSRAILQMGALLAIHKEEPIHTELEGVRETLDSAMNSIRSSVHDLHDDSIDVKANISDMAKALRDKFNVNMDLDIGNDTPRPVKYAIIGITKECISNIIKHSTNTDVDIKLNEHPSMYQLIIHDYSLDKTSDSGSANESAKNKNNETNSENFDDYGMGLENIRSRVESVNGTLNISNHNGFRVFVSIPRK